MATPAQKFVGCSKCGTVLNAKAADCDGDWHSDNQTSLQKLEDFMWAEFPRAVKQADGDAVLAALQLLNMAREVVIVYWPIVKAQVTALIGQLESAGIDLGPKLTQASPHDTIGG